MQTKGAYSPINAYVIGIAGLGLGMHAVLRPREEYGRFGLPLESAGRATGTQKDKASSTSPDEAAGHDPGHVSPLIYVKGIREISYGLALIGLQYEGNAAGVTIVAGVMALAGLGDGLVVWFRGRKDRRYVALGHWIGGFLGLGGWAGWRAFRAYGERAAFHALHC